MPQRVSSEFERIVRGRDGAPGASGEAAAERSRAAAVADAIVATQRRETAVGAALAGGGRVVLAPDRTISAQSTARGLPVHAPPPLGQSHGRRTRNRVSASAGRRDTR